MLDDRSDVGKWCKGTPQNAGVLHHRSTKLLKLLILITNYNYTVLLFQNCLEKSSAVEYKIKNRCFVFEQVPITIKNIK